ncbi:MAG: phosphoglycerate kinase [Betaproteobacteria bacterium]|nr:phosphoglycerate kinase [Betaproteobacteria bacterium]
MKRLADFDWKDKVALVRADLNVPVRDGRITDTARIEAIIPTLRELLAGGAGVVLLSHFGRPPEGSDDVKWSLAPVAKNLSELIGKEVAFCKSLDQAQRPASGQLLMIENTRLNPGEKSGDETLAKRYASLGDVFVLEAFGSAHRKDASLVATAKVAPARCAGLLVEKEVAMLGRARQADRRPQTVIVGGAKISDKLGALTALAADADRVLVGGGIANTLLVAQGVQIGKSLREPDMHEAAEKLLASCADKFMLPSDVKVAAGFDSAQIRSCPVDQVAGQEMILDIGDKTAASFAAAIAEAGTVIWAGAMGVFEKPQFAAGTEAVARALAESSAYTVAGGGETLAALRQFGCEDRIDYVTTGGSAFLEFMEGKQLPAIEALQ